MGTVRALGIIALGIIAFVQVGFMVAAQQSALRLRVGLQQAQGRRLPRTLREPRQLAARRKEAL